MERGDTKERLLHAGERLFARKGIHAVRNREINELADQRNQSALHYHFGSRAGLVDAILGRHQHDVDGRIAARLDELDAGGGAPPLRELVLASVAALAVELESESGRDFLRIVPQILGRLEHVIRQGGPQLGTPTTDRVLRLVAGRLGGFPDRIGRERLVAYILVMTALFAEQAEWRESGADPGLTPAEFVLHAADVLEAVLTAPSSIGTGRPRRQRPR